MSTAIIVAIDFGTSRSTWAYRIKGQSDDNIFVRIPQGSLVAGKASLKTDTAILLGDEGRGECIAFGREAQERVFEGEDEGFALFCEFPVILCTLAGYHSVYAPTTTAQGGQTVSLLHVMSAALRYFKDDILAYLSSIRAVPAQASDITWVLTFPVIFSDFAKQFMRHAAHKAGITDNVNSPSLQFCPTQEAACLAVTVKDHPLTCEAEGRVIMVLDCGGCTVDITVHRVESISPLRLIEALPPDGGRWGSMVVDQAFKNWLKSFFGDTWFAAIEDTPTLHALMADWERRKEAFGGQDSDRVRLNLVEFAAERGLSARDFQVKWSCLRCQKPDYTSSLTMNRTHMSCSPIISLLAMDYQICLLALP